MKQRFQHILFLIFCSGLSLIIFSVQQNMDYIEFWEYMKDINLTLYEERKIYVRNTNKNSSLCNKDLVLGQPIVLDKSCKNCDWLTCKTILFHPTKFKSKRIHKMMKVISRNQSVRTENLLKMLEDCEGFREAKGYPHLAYSEEELEFPIAFNILVHQNFEQVERLLRALYFPQNLYCIHVDAKQDRNFKNAIQALARCFDNVFVPNKTEVIAYAGFSRLQADINCMEESLKRSTYKWKYLLNLAGQSWPLRSNLEMVKILKIYNGSNDIEGIYPFPFSKIRTKPKWKEKRLFFKGQNKTELTLVRTFKRNKPPPAGLNLVKGSAYGAFSRGFIEWVLRDKVAIKLLQWSRTTYSPDELYWATLHHTSVNQQLKAPGGYSGKPDQDMWQSTYVLWLKSADTKLFPTSYCHGYWKHDICVFGSKDLPNLIHKTQFFANKFDIQFDSLALDCMEQWIKYKNNCNISFDTDFYKKLKFIRKK